MEIVFFVEMIKILRNRFVLCSIVPNLVYEEVTLDKYKTSRGLHIEDPWQRVKCIFTKDAHGEYHPDLSYALQMLQLGFCVGLCYGGMWSIINRAEDYLRSNESRIFSNKREAMSAFINHNTLTFIRGGVKWAPVFGIFFSGFSLVVSVCEAYRNKPHIIDSSVGGFVVGSLSRFMFGIKGMISGAIVGGTLGSIYGVFVWGLSKLTKTDQIELKYAQYALTNYRKQLLSHVKTEKTEEIEAIEKIGMHSIHVINPLDELDSDNETANSSKEIEKK